MEEIVNNEPRFSFFDSLSQLGYVSAHLRGRHFFIIGALLDPQKSQKVGCNRQRNINQLVSMTFSLVPILAVLVILGIVDAFSSLSSNAWLRSTRCSLSMKEVR